jgi:polysaccharide chain length determinant protein (PEP-CTERM system associated)
MDPSNIRELINAFIVEVLRYRYWIVIFFVVISAAVLGAGYLMPKSYNSKVVLYADQTNIIGDLLKGKAEITKIDRSREVRNIIYTNRILTSAAAKSGFDNPENAIGGLRNAIKVRSRGDYVDIEYSADNKEQAFTVVSNLTDLFIDETSRKKREESQSAFEFIDSQVQSYKKQLEDAEQRLKEFSAENIDVSEQSVSSRVSSLKRDIQAIELEVQDAQARLNSFESQLLREPQFLNVETQETAAQTYAERQLENFELQLSNLRLSYLDTHPDIVSLLSQIDTLKEQIANEKQSASQTKNFEQVENPAYTNLKDVYNEERANLTAKQQRLRNLKTLLAAELSNAEIVAEKQATYAELTRDYDVTKGVYDDMLKRRESARLSMTLDVQGQGVTYKIHEPPLYPINWEGLQLKHYAVIGPFLGLAVPLGLILVLVVLDPRIRSSSYMEQNLPPQIELITSVPVYENVISQYSSKRSLILLGMFVFAYMLVYAVFVLGVQDVNALLSGGLG